MKPKIAHSAASLEGGRPQRSVSGTQRRPPLALLVDDLAESREMYADILRDGGYLVVEAEDGVDAVELAIERRPDVIVLDMCMPRMDGWDAVRMLKADPRTARTPVVALTARGWSDRSSGLELAAYLVKPCLPRDLLGVVDVLLLDAAPFLVRHGTHD